MEQTMDTRRAWRQLCPGESDTTLQALGAGFTGRMRSCPNILPSSMMLNQDRNAENGAAFNAGTAHGACTLPVYLFRMELINALLIWARTSCWFVRPVLQARRALTLCCPPKRLAANWASHAEKCSCAAFDPVRTLV
eukprot:6189643-Pleurochrysis_carterae.AAC.3